MKYMIASDLHGDAVCTARLLEIYKKEGCQRLIILGDILYHGPRNDLPSGYAPKKVIALLNDIKDDIIALNGNCDAEVDAMVLDFPITQGFITMKICGVEAVLTHGHRYNRENEPRCEYRLLLHGHTHVQCIRSFGDGKVYLNPGSTSIPKEGNPPSFAIAEGEKITIYDFDMNVINSIDFSR